MKKVLYGTTALATAGLMAGVAGEAAAAERIKVGIAGYHQQWLVGNWQDFNDDDAGRAPQGFKNATFDQKHNSEICFVGETTLDNGITVGINVQLEANTSADQIDESYMYVESERFGKLLLGDENNAGYLLSLTTPNGGVSVDSGDILNVSMFVNTTGVDFYDTPAGTTKLRLQDNDSGKFTYITPRYWGFQAGVSYVPISEPAGGDSNTSNYNAVAGIHDTFVWGLNFKETFNGFGVQLAAGGMYGGQTVAIDGDGSEEVGLTAHTFGAQFSYAGFSLGGSYLNASSGRRAGPAATGTLVTGDSFSVGAAYETGPYAVGVECLVGSADWTVNDSSEVDTTMCMLSGGYQLGPGIRLVGGIFYYDLEAEDGKNPDGSFINQNVSDTDGFGGAVGFKLSF